MQGSEGNDHAVLGLLAPPQDWMTQVRQISVSVWARALALTLSIAVLLPGILLIWSGWLGCSELMKDWLGNRIVCHENWIAQGTQIVVATLVPVVVILYLVFAETGMRSLARRTNELLEKTVPQALRAYEGEVSTYVNGLQSCAVVTSAHADSGLSAHYLLQYRLDESSEGRLRLTVSVNVNKAVIVFFLPMGTKADKAQVRRLMAPTIQGAMHEGYVFDEELVETTREGQQYCLLIARRNLPADFLWNPAAKLHFAWDLRAFAYSVIHDGHALLQS